MALPAGIEPATFRQTANALPVELRRAVVMPGFRQPARRRLTKRKGEYAFARLLRLRAKRTVTCATP